MRGLQTRQDLTETPEDLVKLLSSKDTEEKSVVEADDRKYPCTECEYKANKPDHLRRHKLKIHLSLFGHEGGLSLNTEIKTETDTTDSDSLKSWNNLFDFKTGRIDSLKRHKKKVHSAEKSYTNQSTKSFNCEYCTFTFSRRDNLKRHAEKKHH